MGLLDGYVLNFVKPFYGIPESGLHWYLTYLNHHINELGMTRSRADPCVLYRRTGTVLDGVIVLQVDDSLGVGSTGFLDEEGQESKPFRCKYRSLIEKKPITFNGRSIRWDGNAYKMTQTENIEKLKPPSNDSEYVSMRALAQYVGFNTRPSVCAPVQLLVSPKEGITSEQTRNCARSSATSKTRRIKD